MERDPAVCMMGEREKVDTSVMGALGLFLCGRTPSLTPVCCIFCVIFMCRAEQMQAIAPNALG